MIKRYVIASPDGFAVSLVGYVDGFVQPAGPTMLHMAQLDMMNPEKYVNKIAGMFGEYAQPVKDISASIGFYEILGFKVLSKHESPYKWAILTDGLGVIGLHETTSFTTPTITFFAKDMKEKISKLKESGLKDFKEMGSGNIVLTTPENQRVNLFSLGM
jgi:hypothetical protein